MCTRPLLPAAATAAPTSLVACERDAFACIRGVRTCSAAAEGGHLEVLQWARAHDCPWNEARVREYAAAGGHVDMLGWLDEHGE
jgi:hypothetical protein